MVRWIALENCSRAACRLLPCCYRTLQGICAGSATATADAIVGYLLSRAYVVVAEVSPHV